MPFRGLTILKSPKLIIKGGLCYGFAMVFLFTIILSCFFVAISDFLNSVLSTKFFISPLLSLYPTIIPGQTRVIMSDIKNDMASLMTTANKAEEMMVFL